MASCRKAPFDVLLDQIGAERIVKARAKTLFAAYLLEPSSQGLCKEVGEAKAAHTILNDLLATLSSATRAEELASSKEIVGELAPGLTLVNSLTAMASLWRSLQFGEKRISVCQTTQAAISKETNPPPMALLELLAQAADGRGSFCAPA